MTPKKSKTNIKTKAKRVVGSTSASDEEFDRVQFHSLPNAQKFETLVQYKSLWSEEWINLEELDPFIWQKLDSRGWLPLCFDLVSPLVALIREFYLNISIHFASFGGHLLTTWIRGEEFQITKKIVYTALSVPLIQHPTYPYIESPLLDNVMSLLYGRTVSWGSKPRPHSHELIEVNYLLFRIACHNIFHISHVHTIPIDRCIFLYIHWVSSIGWCYVSSLWKNYLIGFWA